MSLKIVIIGGVACGPKAAARARRRDPEARITIIERRPYVSFASCGLPYYCLLYTSPSPRDRTRSRMPSSA